MTIKLFVDSRNGTPRRVVRATQDGAELHRDTLDTDNAWARECFARKVAQRLKPAGPGAAEFDVDGFAEQIVRQADKIDAKELERIAPEVSYRHLSSAELFSGDFAPRYIINGVLAENEQCLWAGPEKGMKTSMAMDAAIALAGGGCWLGYFPVPKRRRVAVMSGEAGATFLQDLGRRICVAAGRNPAEIGIEWFLDLPILGDERHRAPLSKMLVDYGVEVLFLDCSYLMIDADGGEGSIFQMGKLLHWVSDICRGANCSLVLIHHTTKSPSYTPIELSSVAWSGFGPWAAQWVLVNRREAYDPNGGLHRLWLSVGSRLGHGGRWHVDIFEGRVGDEGGRCWQTTVSTPAEAKEDAERQKANRDAERQERTEAEHQRKLAAALLTFPQGETATVLKQVAGLNTGHFATAIRALINSGKAEKFDVLKQGIIRDAYRPKG